MESAAKTVVTIEATINAPVQKVWEYWTKPEHITKWCFAMDEWHCPTATNDLRVGGKYTSRMEAKDGSMGFDFGGEYDEIKTHELISSTLGDGRKVVANFSEDNGQTRVVESFEAEETNPVEMQRGGWQAILDNFKSYVEAN